MQRLYYRAMTSRARVVGAQLEKLRSGLPLLARQNPFYQAKLANVDLDVRSMDAYRNLPFTTKDELVENQAAHPPHGTNLTFATAGYTRIHSTSGTTGRRLKVLDTEESFRWFTRCWQDIYRLFGIGPGDRVFAAFGFGPFIGFWAGFEAAHQVGAQAIPGGGLSSLQRLHAIRDFEATVLLSTPTYALRLAEEARENGIDLRGGSVRAAIHAGEPGASIPATRARIESAWGARVWDHAGLSEVGPWGYECPAGEGLHALESEFVAEVLEVGSDSPVREGEMGELTLSNLGRWAAPAIRYRTGDLVRYHPAPCSCGSPFLVFPGGVLGRVDEMIPVRGVNVYPSALESIIRAEDAVSEFQIEVFERRGMWELRVQVEVIGSARPEGVRSRLESEIHLRLGLRAEVTVVPAGSLPRFDLKARRFHVTK
jgi:phenylacetate-CoA ligase